MAILFWKQREFSDIKGALSPTEISYLRKGLPRDLGDTHGEIIEFGTYLGLSTDLLNQHLRRNENHFCYDRFIWEEWMKGGTVGESFRELFLKNTEECVRLHVQEGDIQKYKWNGCGIRLMFIDAFKCKATASHVIKNWFMYMNHGGLILDQDFMWGMQQGIYEFCILWYYRLRQNIKPIVRVGTTIVFRVIECMDFCTLNRVLDTRPTFKELTECMNYWSGIVE